MKPRARKAQEEREAERLRLQKKREDERLARQQRYHNRTESSSSQKESSNNLHNSDSTFQPPTRNPRVDQRPMVDLNSPYEHYQHIFDSSFSTMAGPSGQFDPTDPIFSRLTSPQRRHLNTLLTAQINHAKQVMKVVTFNSSIEIPEWDSRKMTADTFITKCKNYLSAQGQAS
jgi:hypothetical protein